MENPDGQLTPTQQELNKQKLVESKTQGCQTLPDKTVVEPAQLSKTVAAHSQDMALAERDGAFFGPDRTLVDSIPSTFHDSSVPGSSTVSPPAEESKPDAELTTSIPVAVNRTLTGPDIQVADNRTLTAPDAVTSAPETSGVPTPSGPHKNEAGNFGYDILDELGKGGMGIVYLARQKALGREVALKMVLNPAMASTMAMRRFEAEARLLGKIDHPNIVKVHDFGLTPQKLPYFALEYCPGGSLSDMLKRETPSPALAARLMAAMARAIGAAHQAGIVHRDLKPGNVLLRDKAESIEALSPSAIKVADFGLAKPTDESEDTSLHTKTGAVFGTLKYMAPEQAQDSTLAREPADIYALGVILYEMLVGRVPFVGKDNEILRQLERDEPVPVRKLAPSCPRDLETICLKCLEKDSGRRYPTAEALADDLEAFLGDRPIMARPAGRLERSVKWVRRNPGSAAAGAAAAALVLVMVLGVASFLWERARAEREAANIRLEESEKRAEEQRRNLEEQGRLERQAAADKAAGERLERVRGLISQLETVAPEGVRGLLEALDAEAEVADPLMRFRWQETVEPRTRGRLALALLPRRTDLAGEVAKAAEAAPPGEIPVYAIRLKPLCAAFLPRWREQVQKALGPADQLPSAALLALLAPQDAWWSQGGPRLADTLASMSAFELAPWLPLVKEIAGPLSPGLLEMARKGFAENADTAAVARAESAAGVLAALPTEAWALAEAVTVCNARGFDLLSRRVRAEAAALAPELQKRAQPSAKEGPRASVAIVSLLPPEVAGALGRDRAKADARWQECRHRARAIAALAFIDQPGELWKALADASAPDLISEIRFVAPAFQVSAASLANRYGRETNPTARRNLLALLGAFDAGALPEAVRKPLEENLIKEFASDGDPGIHGAIEWLLRWKWKRGADLENLAKTLRQSTPPREPGQGHGWRINSQGQVLVSVPQGMKFDMGADPGDPDRTRQGRLELEKRHAITLKHGFEIGAREVTLKEYREFRTDHVAAERNNPEADDHVPVTGVSWLDAAAYCQWLSDKEKISGEHQCFNKSSGLLLNMTEEPFRRMGYRLPTEEEWELAARAGNTMSYPCGNHDRHLNEHGVTWANARDRLWPCGCRLPNAWGLFDTSGNALEWTLDKFMLYDDPERKVFKDAEPRGDGRTGWLVVDNLSLRVLRGGSFASGPASARMSARGSADAGLRAATNGFRICRTTIPKPLPSDRRTLNSSDIREQPLSGRP